LSTSSSCVFGASVALDQESPVLNSLLDHKILGREFKKGFEQGRNEGDARGEAKGEG